jgi:pyruvate dehydrogenase E2 component (dihydrolipoamide acetyltransferase)
VIPVTVPRLSLSMEEGKIVSWLVKDGDRVGEGQPVVEVETDKATMEVESPAEGTIRIVVEEGAVVGIDAKIAEIAAAGGEPAAAAAPTDESTEEAPARVDGGGAHDMVPSRPAAGRGKQTASPAARRLADELEVDLAEVEGSGPGGRIVAEDVQRALGPRPREAPATTSDLRRAVLTGIAASWREIPHIHVGGEVAAEGVLEARRLAGERAAEHVTVTDLLILAVARALTDVPDVNGTLRGDGSVAPAQRVNLALAVATEYGVVAPVVRDAGDLGVGAIARARARLVDAARAGALEKRDFGGATCTLSNLGGYPVDFFAPVVTGPQIATVATGRIAEKPVAIDGMIAVRPRLWVNIAIDHRAADGEAGGRLLAALERRLGDLPRSI